MATTVTKTDDMVRFVQGTEAAYMASTSTFKNDVYVCTDTGTLYVRGQNMNTRRHYRQYPVQNGVEMLFNTGLKSTRSNFFIWRFVIDNYLADAPTDILIQGYTYQPTSGPVLYAFKATAYGAQVFETIKAYMYNGYVWFWFPAGAAADFKTYTAELIDHHVNGTFDMGQAAWSTGSVPDEATGTVTMTVKYMALQSDLTALQSTVSNQNVSSLAFDSSTRALTLTKGDGSTVNDTLPVASESTASGYGLLGAQAWGDLSSQVTTLQGKVAGSTTVTQGTDSVEVALNDTNGNELTSATVGAASSTQAGVMTSAQVNTLTSHVADTNNPHGVTKAQVGLGNVNNTADKDKEVSLLNIKWNFSSNPEYIRGAMFTFMPTLNACRSQFAPASAITVEYSNDGGATWTDYGATDEEKSKIFSLVYPAAQFQIGKKTSYAVAATAGDDRLRISIDLNEANIFTEAVAIVFESNFGECRCDISASTFVDPETFTTLDTGITVVGWGWYTLHKFYHSIVGTWANAAASTSTNYRILRFDFYLPHDVAVGGAIAAIWKILIYGVTHYRTPSTMATTGHLYDYDYQQNAKFPAKIYTNKNVQVIDTAGTGLTKSGSTLSVAPKTVLDSFGTATDSPSDDTYYVATGSSASDGNYYRRKMSTLYSYMEGKLPDASSTARGLMTTEQVSTLSDAASNASNAYSLASSADTTAQAVQSSLSDFNENEKITAVEYDNSTGELSLTRGGENSSLGALTAQLYAACVIEIDSSTYKPTDNATAWAQLKNAATTGRPVVLHLSDGTESRCLQARDVYYNNGGLDYDSTGSINYYHPMMGSYTTLSFTETLGSGTLTVS